MLSTTEFPLPSFAEVAIVGNAAGDWQPAETGVTFVFNGTRAQGDALTPDGRVINIANGPYAGVAAAFEVQGSRHREALIAGLTATAQTLEKELGCWPSSGLTTLVLMARTATRLRVSRMSLLPSLARPPGMRAEQHLPCMVHNWLGERRIALALAADLSPQQLDWPELYLASPVSAQTLSTQALSTQALANQGRSTQAFEPGFYAGLTSDPFPVLQALAKDKGDGAAEPAQGRLSTLDLLANSGIDLWLQHADDAKLRAAEALFFNQTPELCPSVWYLVDNQASLRLDAIRQRLAYCQQRRLLAARNQNSERK
ncbi:hypothetical protein [Shewanella salipaludis]|uniref:Uncharacterized protein n=1 Tax=Shewanella salipaludis TaxID=2723052 RepID=A0A972FY33_9GAMM|nr:hypothetical protein [Shewanella salipaludis]NMH64021.1 hypothetical protein [Shewanella salipaludis]